MNGVYGVEVVLTGEKETLEEERISVPLR